MKLGKLHIHRHHLPHISAGIFALMMLLGVSGPALFTSKANASLITYRSVTISDSTPSESGVKYLLGFTPDPMDVIGSFTVTICSNYLFNPTDPCTPPSGFDGSGVTLSNQTGVTDFSIDSSSTSNVWLLRRPGASLVAATPLTYEFSNLVNPDYVGTVYVRVALFNSTDGSGPESNYGNMVISTSPDIEITTEVPPYLLFCTGIVITTYSCSSAVGDQISFGELSTSVPRYASSQMLSATNAANGFSITLAGTTMTAGINAIPALAAPTPSSPGASQFGLNAVANSAPTVGDNPTGPGLIVPGNGYENPNLFKFKSGDIIASSPSSDDYRKTTVSYIVNRNSSQAPGRYVATISYIALANF